MHDKRTARRPRGSGSIIVKAGAYYGKWRVGDRQVLRKLGPVRRPSGRDGLTQTMAEARLRELMAEVIPPPVGERVTVEEAGRRHLTHLEAMGRKASTLRSYRNQFDGQLVPRLGTTAIAALDREQVDQLVAALARDGLAPKTIRNVIGLLNGICEFAVKHRWAKENPCRYVDRPHVELSEDIRFLEPDEVEAVLRAIGEDDFGRVHRAMILTAAMSGLRMGELIALRWQDVDWQAQRIRVRRNYVRGQFGTPKSRRGSRSVPLADRLGGELDRHHRQSAYQADQDLVFGNPHAGTPLDGAALLRAFQRALKPAGVRHVRFHDLRHTFGTRMAAAGVPMRTLQEWMGHRDLRTTLIYADYSPGAHEVDLVNEAFAPSTLDTKLDTKVRPTRTNSDPRDPVEPGDIS
jgi:integrase